jgi:hypothetical protein
MTEQAREHLSQLAVELSRHGWEASFTSSAKSTLRVRNPRASGLGDRVSCEAGSEPSFVWESGPTIGPVTDIEAAVKHIQHVLRDVVEETR